MLLGLLWFFFLCVCVCVCTPNLLSLCFRNALHSTTWHPPGAPGRCLVCWHHWPGNHWDLCCLPQAALPGHHAMRPHHHGNRRAAAAASPFHPILQLRARLQEAAGKGCGRGLQSWIHIGCVVFTELHSWIHIGCVVFTELHSWIHIGCVVFTELHFCSVLNRVKVTELISTDNTGVPQLLELR